MQTGPQLINFIHVVLFIMQISSNVFKSTCGGGAGVAASAEDFSGLQSLGSACSSWMDPAFHTVSWFSSFRKIIPKPVREVLSVSI